jgi:glutamate-1-semialdehyde aminotransferase
VSRGRALPITRTWEQPGSRSARLFAEAQRVMPGEQLAHDGVHGMEDCLVRAGLPGRVTGIGSLFRAHLTGRELVDFRSTRLDAAEAGRLAAVVRSLLEHGVLLAPTGLGCLSTPMTDVEMEGFRETFAACLAEVKTA